MMILRDRGLDAGGVICPEIRLGTIRLGFEIVDLLSGKKGTLFHINQSAGPKIGKYFVNLQDLSNIGVEAINRALNEADYIVVDEVGPMELQGKDFQKAVMKAVESSKPVLGVLHWRMNHPVIDAIKARKDVELLEVTRGNRETISDAIAEDILESVKH